jgi:hypothetical protein
VKLPRARKQLGDRSVGGVRNPRRTSGQAPEASCLTLVRMALPPFSLFIMSEGGRDHQASMLALALIQEAI